MRAGVIGRARRGGLARGLRLGTFRRGGTPATKSGWRRRNTSQAHESLAWQCLDGCLGARCLGAACSACPAPSMFRGDDWCGARQ